MITDDQISELLFAARILTFTIFGATMIIISTFLFSGDKKTRSNKKNISNKQK